MRERATLLAPLLAALASLVSVQVAVGADDAVRAAVAFGQALEASESGRLQAVLPSKGKVHMRLVRLGPEKGTYSSGQVVALFGDFLRHGRVREFKVVRSDDRSGYALVHARTNVVDRKGRSTDVDLHLTLEPEGGRWVLREIRESSP